VHVNPPSHVGHWPTMSPPLTPPHLLLHVQLVVFVASHVHYVQLPKSYKSLAIDPNPSRENKPAICVNSDSSEPSSYTIKSLLSKLEGGVRKIMFDDMHPKVSKVEQKKYVGPDLLKHRASLSEEST
jgi:hypothetical protein